MNLNECTGDNLFYVYGIWGLRFFCYNYKNYDKVAIMYISSELLNNNCEDKKAHLKKMIKNALENMNDALNNNKLDKNTVIDTISCINAFIELNNLELKLVAYDIAKINLAETIKNILNAYYEDFIHKNIDLHFSFFEHKDYIFEEDNYKNIQQTLNQLRDDLISCDIFEDEHKQRLLSKLESLQKELHKKMSSLDKALGQLVTIASALGTAGEKAKPMFDRINETIKSVLRVQNKKDKIIKDESALDYSPFSKIDSKYTSNNDIETDIV